MTQLPHELDVRPILRAGGEPFSAIMEAVNGLAAGQSFRLLATFEPVPLYGVLAKKGFDHTARADRRWRLGGDVHPGRRGGRLRAKPVGSASGAKCFGTRMAGTLASSRQSRSRSARADGAHACGGRRVAAGRGSVRPALPRTRLPSSGTWQARTRMARRIRSGRNDL